MSLTNTDPRKTDLFAKFNWPRVSNPHIDFSLPELEQTKDVIERERKSEQEIMKFVEDGRLRPGVDPLRDPNRSTGLRPRGGPLGQGADPRRRRR